MTKESLFQDALIAFYDLMKNVTDLDDEAMSRTAFGVWNTKQMLAHIAGWQRFNADMMERMARGEHPIPAGEDFSDDDRMNAGFAAEVEGKTAAEAVQFARDAFNRFTRGIDALPPERFEDGRFAAQIVQGNGIDHVREHIAEIRAWKAMLGAT